MRILRKDRANKIRWLSVPSMPVKWTRLVYYDSRSSPKWTFFLRFRSSEERARVDGDDEDPLAFHRSFDSFNNCNVEKFFLQFCRYFLHWVDRNKLRRLSFICLSNIQSYRCRWPDIRCRSRFKCFASTERRR